MSPSTLSVTQTYRRIHRTYIEEARQAGLHPHDLRVLLAVYEHGNVVGLSRSLRSDELEEALGEQGSRSSLLRRSLLALYEAKLAVGHPRRRGSRTVVTLTEEGMAVAGRMYGAIVAAAA